jgi:hypothetical protein
MRNLRLFWLGLAASLCLAPAVASLVDTLRSERETRQSLAASRAVAREGRPRLAVDPVRGAAPPAPGRVWLARFATDAAAFRVAAQEDVSVEVIAAPGRPGERAARVTVPPKGLVGFELVGLPRDWRPFRTLALDVFAPSAELALGVRVDDQVGGPTSQRRFETAIPLAAGWNPVRIPVASIGGAIDLRAVLRIVIYAAREVEGRRAPRVLTIGGVWLDP